MENQNQQLEKQMKKIFNDYEDARSGEKAEQSISTGYRELDKTIGQLERGSLYALGGRPGMGKTALALNILYNAALIQNKRCIYFSLKMSAIHLLKKLLCITGQIKAEGAVDNGYLSDKEYETLHVTGDRIINAPITVEDRSRSITEIFDRSSEINEADKVDLIIIDYLQLIEYDGSYTDANRNEELSAECRMLKNLAAKTNAAVLVISELNRTPEYRPDHRPMLSDLRGSGEIEEIADAVMLLYRQDYYHYQENDEVDKNVADLSIAKNNYGPLRSVYLMWNPEMLIFSESAYLGELLHRADMNPAYTFRTFMVNEKNMNAYSKAMEAAKGNPDYRQLYIAGGSGNGKTHLMQAIGEYIFQKNTSVRIKYMTARMLKEVITYGDMNQDIGMVQYVRDGIEENDVIMIDDIEGLSGDNRMQEEAIEILDAMVMCNKQIIIAGSLIPSHVHDISERFRMRLKRMSLCTLGDMDDYTDISE